MASLSINAPKRPIESRSQRRTSDFFAETLGSFENGTLDMDDDGNLFVSNKVSIAFSGVASTYGE